MANSNLDALLHELRSGILEMTADLPRFADLGRERQPHEWSWDETRIVVGNSPNDLRIVSRFPNRTIVAAMICKDGDSGWKYSMGYSDGTTEFKPGLGLSAQAELRSLRSVLAFVLAQVGIAVTWNDVICDERQMRVVWRRP